MVRSWDVAGDLPQIDARDLLRDERRELLALLGTLDAAAWRSPTADPGWTIHDVTLHLLGNDLGRLSAGRDGHQVDTTKGSDVESFAALAARIEWANDVWVSAARRISPRLARQLLGFSGSLLDAHLATTDLAAEGVPVAWSGDGPSPVWLDLAREYTERWVHQQQIRDAVGRPGLRARRWLHPVLDTFMRALPRAYADVDAPEGSEVRVVVDGAAGGAWRLRRGSTRWHLDRPHDEQPGAEVRFAQDVAWRLFTRNVSVAEARASIEMAGDLALAEPAARAVALMTTSV